MSFALITAVLTMAFARVGRPARGGEMMQFASIRPAARSPDWVKFKTPDLSAAT